MKKIILTLLILPLTTYSLEIQNAWARGTVGSQKTSAVYGVFVNNSETEKIITSATSPAAKRTELHTIQHGENGIMSMTELQSVTLPANGELKLQPGSHHIMLIGLHAPLKTGQDVPITLNFEDGTTHTFRAEINPITHRPKQPEEEHKHHDHGHKHHH